MLERLRKALLGEKKGTPASAAAPAARASSFGPSVFSGASSFGDTRGGGGGIPGWAARRGLEAEMAENGTGFTLHRRNAEVPWSLERAKPSRDFIHGAELRGRTPIGLHPDVAVLVANRELKNSLEQRAYAQFTDTLQTAADARMPEEVRWLSMYDEIGLARAPIGFTDMYAVLADSGPHASMWVTPELATELMRWPEAVNAQTPVVLMAFRGNVYLRMEYAREDPAVLEHAALVYDLAVTLAKRHLPQAVG